jgi:hypothetical protein
VRAPLALCCAGLSAATVLAMTGTTAVAVPAAGAPLPAALLPPPPLGSPVATTGARVPPCCARSDEPRAAPTVAHRPAP